MIDKNSMLYWFPKIKDLDIPIPKTEIVEIADSNNFLHFIDHPEDFPKSLLNVLKNVARRIGYPLFLRTDMLSGKHNWKRTCYLLTEKQLYGHVIQLIEESALAGVLGQPINAFVFREFIEFDWKFKAFEGMPVASERRYFIKDGKVICHHPYWIEDAIRFWEKGYEPPENWRELLKEVNTETKHEIAVLESYCWVIGEVMEGYWSVDFARGKDGLWYLIDMAIGEESWHPEDCPIIRSLVWRK